MRILPITNTTVQTKPAFQARIPKQLVKQMLGKTEPLAELNIKTMGIVCTVPAAAAVKLYSSDYDKKPSVDEIADVTRVKKLPTAEELSGMDRMDVVAIARLQDEEGKTIFHHDFNPGTLQDVMNAAPCANRADIFSIRDNNQQTAYQANPKEELKNAIVDTAVDGTLTAQEAVELLETNDMHNGIDRFLRARIEKGDDSSSINCNTLDQIEDAYRHDSDSVCIETEEAFYPKLSIENAALIFTMEHPNAQYMKLDKNYLLDSNHTMRALLNSALLSNDANAIREVCSEFAEENPEAIVENIDLSKLEGEHIGVVSDALDNKSLKNLFLRTDENGDGSVHYIAAGTVNNGDFEEFFKLLNEKLSQDDVKEILSMKNQRGYLPITISDEAANVVLDYYKNDPEFILNQFSVTDNTGATALHTATDDDVLRKAFDILKDKPEELADILMIKDNDGDTVYNSLFAYDNAPLTEIVKDKMIELATDSDLSIEKSINLLKRSGVEPQIQEYLKLQQANTNKSL